MSVSREESITHSHSEAEIAATEMRQLSVCLDSALEMISSSYGNPFSNFTFQLSTRSRKLDEETRNRDEYNLFFFSHLYFQKGEGNRR